MKYFYSASRNGFFLDGLHVIPPDAIEITEARHKELLQGQAEGRRISSENDGSPVFSIPTLEESKAKLKAQAQAEKKRARDGGVVVDGTLFDTDTLARLSYQDFKDQLADNSEYKVDAWRASPGVFVCMDAALFAKVRAAGAELLTAVFTWQMAREAEIDQATTAEALEAIDLKYMGE